MQSALNGNSESLCYSRIMTDHHHEKCASQKKRGNNPPNSYDTLPASAEVEVVAISISAGP